jgi:hypothetical protein
MKTLNVCLKPDDFDKAMESSIVIPIDYKEHPKKGKKIRVHEQDTSPMNLTGRKFNGIITGQEERWGRIWCQIEKQNLQ